jgi:hypothetical protein
MTSEKLERLYHYAWDTFYDNGSPALRMANLFKKVIQKEMEDGTYQRQDLKLRRSFMKKAAT